LLIHKIFVSALFPIVYFRKWAKFVKLPVNRCK